MAESQWRKATEGKEMVGNSTREFFCDVSDEKRFVVLTRCIEGASHTIGLIEKCSEDYDETGCTKVGSLSHIWFTQDFLLDLASGNSVREYEEWGGDGSEITLGHFPYFEYYVPSLAIQGDRLRDGEFVKYMKPGEREVIWKLQDHEYNQKYKCCLGVWPD